MGGRRKGGGGEERGRRWVETDAPLGGLLPVSLLIKIRRSETEEEAEEEEGEEEEGEEEEEEEVEEGRRAGMSHLVPACSCVTIWNEYGSTTAQEVEEPTRSQTGREGGREGEEGEGGGGARGAHERRHLPTFASGDLSSIHLLLWRTREVGRKGEEGGG